MKVEFINRHGLAAHYVVCDIHYDGLVHSHAVAINGKTSTGGLQIQALRGAMTELESYLAHLERKYALANPAK